MAAAMIGYMLGNACLFQPVLQRGLGEAVIEADKDSQGEAHRGTIPL